MDLKLTIFIQQMILFGSTWLAIERTIRRQGCIRLEPKIADNGSEFSEFMATADASGSAFLWTEDQWTAGEPCGTGMLSRINLN